MSISHCVQRGLAPLFKLCIPLRQAYYHHPIVMQVWKSSTSWCLRVSLPPPRPESTPGTYKRQKQNWCCVTEFEKVEEEERKMIRWAQTVFSANYESR